MKKSLLFIALFIPLLCVAQTISELDNKNGFKDFNLGDDYSKWSTQTLYLTTKDDGTKVYKYTGYCCNRLFEYAISEIELGFLDSKLVAIYIETEYFQKPYSESKQFTTWRKDDFEKINNSFRLLFGEPTGVNTDGDITSYWQSKSVFLRSTYKYLGVRDGDRQEIFVFSLEYLKKQMAKGF